MEENGDTGDGLAEQEQDLRKRAVKRIKRKRELRRNVAIYLLANAVLWGIWALNGAHTDDLWPAWVSGIWGFFLALDALKLYTDDSISDQEIQNEMSRIRG